MTVEAYVIGAFVTYGGLYESGMICMGYLESPIGDP